MIYITSAATSNVPISMRCHLTNTIQSKNYVRLQKSTQVFGRTEETLSPSREEALVSLTKQRKVFCNTERSPSSTHVLKGSLSRREVSRLVSIEGKPHICENSVHLTTFQLRALNSFKKSVF